MTYVGAAAYAFLPRLVRAYRERFPDVELELREGTTSAQIRALRMGEADVGLVRPPIAGADDLRSEVVLREPLVAVLPDRHPLAGQARLRLQDLRDEGFVLFPAQEGPSFHARIVSACEQAGFSMRVVQEAVQMHAIIGLVSAGVGVALVPASMRNLRQVGVVYRDLTESPAELRADLALVWRRGEPSSVVTAFLDLARKLPNDGGDDQAATGEGPQCTERWAGERGPVCR
jgi:DNA-binding transcriptional LysR family regulator